MQLSGTQNYTTSQSAENQLAQNITNLLQNAVAGMYNGKGEGGGTDKKLTLTSREIGTYVDYTPTPGSYTAETIYTGNNKNLVFSTETDIRWRIFEIDDTNLWLIADRPTNTSLALRGVLGYNNGVTLLNNISRECYSNAELGATGRTMDINTVIGKLASGVGPTGTPAYGSQSYYTYSGKFPTVWYDNERISWKQASINRSTDYGLTTATTISGTNIKPYNSYWDPISLSDSSKWISQEYYELFTPVARREDYWLGTRYVMELTRTIRFRTYVRNMGCDMLRELIRLVRLYLHRMESH